MDEQRVQAYVGLIEELLGCPQGQEEAILQGKAELVDAGLVGVMGQYADLLEGQGNSNAGWLRQFAGQVAQALGLTEANSAGASSGDARGFLMEILQLIAQTQGDPAQVYGFFRANLSRLDQALLAALPDVFQELIQQNDKTLIEAVFVKFGNLINQFPLGQRRLNLEIGISCYEQVLTVMTQTAMPIEWANTTMNLATAYKNRIKGDRSENIEEAIRCYEQALTVMTQTAMPIEWAQTTNNLANAYSNRIKGDQGENIEQAIAHYSASLTIFTPTSLPHDCRKTARSLANLYSDEQRWSEAIPIYDQALTAAEILYQSATLLDSKSASLSETADLPRRAAYAFARTGDLSTAVLTLEQGRARGLTESLNRDRANLDHLQAHNPILYNQYQNITQQLRNLEAEQRNFATSADRHSLTPETLRNTALKLRADLETTIEQIRQIPSYEDFLSPTKWQDIAIALQPDNPLIYIATTPNGSIALIVSRSHSNAVNITPVWLDRFNQTQLIDLLNKTWFAAYNQASTDRQAWFDAIDTTTRQLWDLLMGPIVQQLQTLGHPHATLIPTGYLSLLPLHAAWTEDPNTPTKRRYALDAIHFTYAPNAKSLTAAQTIATRVPAHSILAIDNPRQDLPNSQREIDSAIASFPNPTVLRHNQATVQTVRSNLPKAAIVHFSCHGTANLTDPLNSGLVMSDGLLTLKDIFELNLSEGERGIRLAILSACETGMTGTKNADEAISLPTGLLQAGVAAVVASLWSVSDLSTMMLLTKFYDLWREQHLPPDQALRQAQIWLRDTTNDQKVSEFKTFLPTITGTRMSPEIAQQLYDELAWEDKDERSFAHPFHWSAFSYTGV
ncbi:CHAT domain-containing protein [Alkalinema sp. FACHB-956]|uniref:CHAT domain-containing protein n=1 Tax=Alkalinema sp. FACHB-956 TaxID=2692768 RepID=UPI0016842C8F|nr:CHAT domain-containing protein [Alkalinema sp. FACHB-956]MBD2326243.1 CHAT domain-containing protein [Alkalinema sp. FACHB-956]